MALREDRTGQTLLVPRRVVDFILENHICYFVANLLDELDFKKIKQKYRHTQGKQHITPNVIADCYYGLG